MPPSLQRGRHPERLRVVQDHDVTRFDDRGQLGLVALDHAAVPVVLGVPQGAAVTGCAVQVVVQSLGDGEERLVPLDHEPPGVDAGAARIPQEHAQHLRHTAARRRGVDVHDATVAQRFPELVRRAPEQPIETFLAHELGQLSRISGGDVDFVHGRGSLPCQTLDCARYKAQSIGMHDATVCRGGHRSRNGPRGRPAICGAGVAHGVESPGRPRIPRAPS